MKSFIIDRLIAIEEDALGIINKIREREQNLPVLIQQKCNEIEKEIKSEYEEKAKAVKMEKDQDTSEKIKEIKRDSVNRYKTLEEYFEHNHERWEDEIIENITKR